MPHFGHFRALPQKILYCPLKACVNKLKGKEEEEKDKTLPQKETFLLEC
jgi:hypothetical protein